MVLNLTATQATRPATSRCCRGSRASSACGRTSTWRAPTRPSPTSSSSRSTPLARSASSTRPRPPGGRRHGLHHRRQRPGELVRSVQAGQPDPPARHAREGVRAARRITVTNPALAGANPSALFLNVTATGPLAPGYVQVYPTGAPVESVVEPQRGRRRPDGAERRRRHTRAGNHFNVFTDGGGHLLVDLAGWFSDSRPAMPGTWQTASARPASRRSGAGRSRSPAGSSAGRHDGTTGRRRSRSRRPRCRRPPTWREPDHQRVRERPRLAGHVAHVGSSTPTSSRTSRRTACSSVSPGSTNPAMHEYIGIGKLHATASSASLAPADEHDHRRRQPREGEQPARRAAHGPLAGAVGRGRAPTAEPVGATPLDQLHGPAGDGPLLLGQTTPQLAEIEVAVVIGLRRRRRRRGPTGDRAEHAEEVLARGVLAGAVGHQDGGPADVEPQRARDGRTVRWLVERDEGRRSRRGHGSAAQHLVAALRTPSRLRSRPTLVGGRPGAPVRSRHEQRRDRRGRPHARRPPRRRALHDAPRRPAGPCSGAVVARSGIDPAEVGQVVGGCVTQVGEQSFNIARTAWLAPACPCRRRPPRSTPSAARASRPPAWRRRSSAPASSTSPSRAASR